MLQVEKFVNTFSATEEKVKSWNVEQRFYLVKCVDAGGFEKAVGEWIIFYT